MVYLHSEIFKSLRRESHECRNDIFYYFTTSRRRRFSMIKESVGDTAAALWLYYYHNNIYNIITANEYF